MNDHPLRPQQLASLWNCKPRRVRQLLGELEALGFALELDLYGARLCPQTLAEAVRAAREHAQPLVTLRDDPALQCYLTGQVAVDEALRMLLEARTELAILRETVGALWDALQTRTPPNSYRHPDWPRLGLPDPRRGL